MFLKRLVKGSSMKGGYVFVDYEQETAIATPGTL